MRLHAVTIVVLMMGTVHAQAGEQEATKCTAASRCMQYSPMQFGDAYKARIPYLPAGTTDTGINYCPMPKLSILTS